MILYSIKVSRLLLLVLSNLFLCNELGAAQQFAYAITFTDKPVNQVDLSPRSMDRRLKQGITTDSTDYIISPLYIDSTLKTFGSGVILHHRSKWLNHIVVLLNDTLQLGQIRQLDFVKSTHWIGYFMNGLHTQPYDAGSNTSTGSPLKWTIPKQSFDNNWYNFSWQQTHIVSGERLHQLGYFGDGILIALLDEGYVGVENIVGFDSLRYYQRISDAYDFVHNEKNVYQTSAHGTWSLSNISGYKPTQYSGSAPKASVALFITEDKLNEQALEMYNILAASERADSIGADIITVSLGYNQFFGAGQQSLSFSDLDGKTTLAAQAANLSTKKGIVFISSAGNEGGNSWNAILTPGDADSAITIGSVNNNRFPASSSGYGPNASGHVKPNVAAQGEPAYVYSTNGIIGINGTSESTPQIAGWVACLLEARPQLLPFEIKNLLQQSAHLYPSAHPQMGYGVPNFDSIAAKLELASNWQTPSGNGESALIVYGNPVSNPPLQWSFDAGEKGNISMQIFSLAGKKLLMQSLPVTKGVNFFSTPLRFSSGNYRLCVIEKGIKMCKTFTILP